MVYGVGAGGGVGRKPGSDDIRLGAGAAVFFFGSVCVVSEWKRKSVIILP